MSHQWDAELWGSAEFILFTIEMKGDEAGWGGEIAQNGAIDTQLVWFALPVLDFWQIKPAEDLPLVISTVVAKSLVWYTVLFPHTQLLLNNCINSEHVRGGTTSSPPAPLRSPPHPSFMKSVCDRKWFTEKGFPNPLASSICLYKLVLINSKFFLF